MTNALAYYRKIKITLKINKRLSNSIYKAFYEMLIVSIPYHDNDPNNL